jgi:hypothetical protein
MQRQYLSKNANGQGGNVAPPRSTSRELQVGCWWRLPRWLRQRRQPRWGREMGAARDDGSGAVMARPAGEVYVGRGERSRQRQARDNLDFKRLTLEDVDARQMRFVMSCDNEFNRSIAVGSSVASGARLAPRLSRPLAPVASAVQR